MAITLTVGATTINLPPDLFWSDEFEWLPVEQTERRTITGALVVSSAARLGGQPITLQPERDDCAWCARSVLEQAQAWASSPGQEMTLVLRGVTRTVIWRHSERAISSTPIVHYDDTAPGDYYLATFRLLDVTP